MAWLAFEFLKSKKTKEQETAVAEALAALSAGADVHANGEEMLRTAYASNNPKLIDTLEKFGASRGDAAKAAAAQGDTGTAAKILNAINPYYNDAVKQQQESFAAALQSALDNKQYATARALALGGPELQSPIHLLQIDTPEKLAAPVLAGNAVVAQLLFDSALSRASDPASPHGAFIVSAYLACRGKAPEETAPIVFNAFKQVAPGIHPGQKDIAVPDEEKQNCVTGDAEKALIAAAQSGDNAALDNALIKGANPLADGSRALQNAASRGDMLILKLLWMAGGDLADALAGCTTAGDVKGVESLLSTNMFPYTPAAVAALDAAISQNNPKMVTTLLSAQTIYNEDIVSRSATAASAGATEALQAIADHLVQRWNVSGKYSTIYPEGFYYQSLRSAFDAAVAGKHPETAAVAVAALSKYDFPQVNR